MSGQDPQTQMKQIVDLNRVKSSSISNINYDHKDLKSKTPAWLSCELRLNEFSIKRQAFTISGWINVFWKWENAPQKLLDFTDKKSDYIPNNNKNNNDDQKVNNNDHKNDHEKHDDDVSSNSNESNQMRIRKASTITMYTNDEGADIVKISNLFEASFVPLLYFLPINPQKIFFQPSLVSIKHIDNPTLKYNKKSHIAHTQYYIQAQLLENLELFLFPFDFQFLNIKLRWNIDYYGILDPEQEKEFQIPINDDWWGKDQKSITRQREIELFHDKPIKISLNEEIHDEVDMFPAWIDFGFINNINKKKSGDNSNLRFCLIRLRVSRNPKYFLSNVLFPFFIIVSCSFSVFVTPSIEIGDRLSISLTILLTFTAFQSILYEQLPQTSLMLLIDWYIALAYALQALLIAGVSIATQYATEDENDDDGNDTAKFVDFVFGITLATIWILFSFFYVSLLSETLRNFYDKMCCKCFKHVNYNDWEKRAKSEVEGWKNNSRVYHFKVKHHIDPLVN